MQNAELRMRNGSRAFHSAFNILHSPLVLIDDVFTTGATLAEAARALARAGFQSISAVTFGRASLPDFT
jgi:predicted amidophosphoribosyltransferase